VLLETVKKALLIPVTEQYADSELNAYIEACKELIESTGVDPSLVNERNKTVETLVVIYCKTFYGFKNDGSVKELPKAFEMLLRQLILSKGGIVSVS